MKKLFTLFVLCFGMFSSSAFAQDETEDLADYKTACLAAIDNISKIGNNFSIRSMTTIAKASLGICKTKDDMRTAMTVLRAGVLAYLKTVDTFDDGLVLTGLLGNHSFDTGDLSLWYSIGFDLSQVGLTDITNAIGNGDVSGLAKAISVNNWNEDTKAIENEGANAIQDGDQKYYLNSSQLIMQPIMGLPSGIYSLSAKAACNPGLLKLNKVHLNALVVSTDALKDVAGGIFTDNFNWENILSNFNLAEYIVPIVQSGKLYSSSTSCKNLTTFSDGELRFIVDEGDIVVIGINAGMIPFIGTEQFRADNIQLTGLRAANVILDAAKADLSAALQGLTPIEANFNADDENAEQPAFTYKKTITESYNNALRDASDKYENDRLADILTKDDLNDLDGLNAVASEHYSKDIQTLQKAKETFDKHAFIAPSTSESFNIVMKDDWISLFTSKWTGNAVSIDEDMNMQFSQKPGQSVFVLAFSFEKASNDYTNQLRALVNDSHNKYYLSEAEDGKLILTTDQSEAVTITAIPSYTEEGEIHLMIGDMYLGTSSSNNTLIKTDEGSLLRPTRTGLTVAPASEIEITVTIPAGQNVGTLILPFNADLPEGASLFIASSVSEEMPYLEGTVKTSIKPNRPYYIIADAGEYTFCGVSHAVLPFYKRNLLIGRYTPYTTQGGNEYKLTTGEDGYSVFSRMDGQPIAENECYLKCDFPSDIIFISRADAWDGISLAPAATEEGAVYDLSGRRIDVQPSMSNVQLKRGIYITNGRKVAIK